MDVFRHNLELTVKLERNRQIDRVRQGICRQRGMTIVELMIASLILAIGVGGLTVLFATSMTSTSRTKLDTNSTLVAKMVMEQISSQDPAVTSSISLTDCAGTTWSVATAGGASPSGSGALLNTTPGSLYYGGIDFLNQNYSAVPSGYAMKYTDCQAGRTTTYDVRWNIITVNTGTTRMITVAAHQLGISGKSLGGSYFAFPVNIRGVGGPSQ
jgi:prepilin-type N-terminal cleavage/methylation domain-containing protein